MRSRRGAIVPDHQTGHWTVQAELSIKYEIVQAPGLLDPANPELCALPGGGRSDATRLVVLDASIHELYRHRIENYFDVNAVAVDHLILSATEEAKSIESVLKVARKLDEIGTQRVSTPPIAIGVPAVVRQHQLGRCRDRRTRRDHRAGEASMTDTHQPGPLRWGILGATAYISGLLITAIKRSHNGVLVALASRPQSADRAEALAHAHRATLHQDYESLLSDPDVDAVYIPLPNTDHVEWTLRHSRQASTFWLKSRSP
jgi:Oxidoreductase family, NAD-binding Rossmann fold